MSKNVLQPQIKKISTICICACILLISASCTPSEVNPIDAYQVNLVSSPEGDIPISNPVEIVLGVKNFTSQLQNLFFEFSQSNISIAQGGASVVPGQKTSVNLDGSAFVKFTATGIKAGTHTITVRAENGSVSSSCEVKLTISDRVYKVEMLNAPKFRIGEQKAIDIKVTDIQDPQHLFYTTPGYKIAVRSLDDKPAIIVVGVEVLWDSFTGAAIEKTQPVQWVNNETVVMYKGFSIGEHKMEFTVTDPQGYSSRSVHTIMIDSSRISLTAGRIPANVVSVTEAYEVNYKVDYLGHPNNQLSCKWEKLDAGDPYNYPPVLLLDGKMRPPVGTWQEYSRSEVVGVSAYPIAPNVGGSKQGFRMHIKDLWGWDTTFTYRFDVTSSNFTLSLEPMATGVYMQNSLCSADLVLSNYPKGSNMTYKYKVVNDHGENNDAWPVTFLTLDPYNDDWTTLDLSGADGTPLRRSIYFGFSVTNGLNKGAFSVVMVDKFGTEHKATFRRDFAINDFTAATSNTRHNLVVGGSEGENTATINLNYTLGQKGIESFNKTTIQIRDGDPTATVTIDDKVVPYIIEKVCFEGVTNKENPVITYTPHKAGLVTLDIDSRLWTSGSSRTQVKVNAVDYAGAFSAAPDKAAYAMPFEGQYQDIKVTLVSEKTQPGMYDWNETTQLGTTIKYEGTGTQGRIVYAGSVMQTEATRGQSMTLKGAVPATFTLRHYPAAGSVLENVKLTVTRKDGRTAVVNYTLSRDDYGNFSAAPDKAAYAMPFEGQYQDIKVTLVSEKTQPGMYDWNTTSQLGTTIKYEGTGTQGRIVYAGSLMQTEATRGQSMTLKGAVANTFTLRHYPAAGSVLENVKLTVTRKDGRTAVVNYTLSRDNFGSFSATPNQSMFELPYADQRVSQDITITLASGKEPAGVYDWDAANQIGTSITYRSECMAKNNGRLYAVDAMGDEILITPGSNSLLQYAVGKTIKLRHYPAAINGGSSETLKLTITRKDGETAAATCIMSIEDKAFTVVINYLWSSTKVGSVAETGNLVNVTSQSKYYKGVYYLKNYKYDLNGGRTGQAKLETITAKGALGIKHTATVAGWALLASATVTDENGYEISTDIPGTVYQILP